MAYVNVGVKQNGRRVPTKKALKEAAAADPQSLSFDGTSPFTPFYGGVGDIPEGTTLSVVGPDPYTKRTWYASVTVKAGKVTVK